MQIVPIPVRGSTSPWTPLVLPFEGMQRGYAVAQTSLLTDRLRNAMLQGMPDLSRENCADNTLHGILESAYINCGKEIILSTTCIHHSTLLIVDNLILYE